MNIHILGISGNKTAALAIALAKQGHKITGSDQDKIYPPYSNLLKDSNILINQTIISKKIDLAIIGNSYRSFERCIAEFDTIKQEGIPYISTTEYIVKNLINPNSILVAGAYGKTTITSLLSYIFNYLDLNPAYMFGGKSQQLPSLNFAKSQYSIVEADENHNGLDTLPTFLYYPVKYLILTSTNWEHKESFPNKQDNLNAYASLLQKLPSDGVLIYNSLDPDISQIIDNCKCQKIAYSHTKDIKTPLIGKHNQENISAALVLCDYLKLDRSKVLQAISKFTGIQKRLEIISNQNNILIIDDFAQSANRVAAALQAVSYSFPNRRIFVFFEPHATFLQNKSSVVEFKNTFDRTDQVILGKISYSNSIDKQNRVTAKDWLAISPNIKYIPIDDDIKDYLVSNLLPNDILIHFSSGGLNGLNTLNKIKKDILKIHK